MNFIEAAQLAVKDGKKIQLNEDIWINGNLYLTHKRIDILAYYGDSKRWECNFKTDFVNEAGFPFIPIFSQILGEWRIYEDKKEGQE